MSLTLETYPTGGELWVDGRSLGKAPQTLSAVVGTVLSVRAELPGRASTTRQVRVGPEPVTAVLSLPRLKVRTPSRPSGPAPRKPAAFDPDAVGGDP